MIRYALACDRGHEFESWFPSSAGYDDQASRGLVTCPVCDSPKIEKRIMAPSVARSDRDTPRPIASAAPEVPVDASTPAAPEPPQPAQPLTLLSEKEQQVRAMLRAVREHVTRTADHVGPRFPEEARKMHYGDAEHRSIYGEASPDEARALLEEGIEVHPLPMVPEDRN